MNHLQIGALVGAVLALAIWCVRLGLRRAPRTFAVARQAMYGVGAGSPLVPGWRLSIERSGLGAKVRDMFGGGLALVGLTAADVAARVVAASGLTLFASFAALASMSAAGLLPPSAVWLVLAVALALMAGAVMVADVRGKVARRRREVRQAANTFVQLVAVGLTTDQSVEQAIEFALDVGDGAGFELLRSPVRTAPQRGVPVWEAIADVGDRFDVRELGEFAASVERQGLQGVSISDTVATLAAAMRAKALDQLERDADDANANLAGPTIGFVVATIVFLAYPLATRITEAFGG